MNLDPDTEPGTPRIWIQSRTGFTALNRTGAQAPSCSTGFGLHKADPDSPDIKRETIRDRIRRKKLTGGDRSI